MKSGDTSKVLYLSVQAMEQACPPGASFKVNFEKLGAKKCRDNFMTAVDGCKFSDFL